MPDPTIAAEAAGWIAFFIVGVYATVKRRAAQPGTLDEATIEAVRQAVHGEVAPIHKIVDTTQHDLAVLRLEVGRAQAHSEYTADQLREHKEDVSRRLGDMGEALDRRVSKLDERVRAIIRREDD